MSGEVILQGRWVNQNGSVLNIERMEDTRFFGSFESKKGRAARGRTYPVVGLHNGELVSFAVDFDDGEENLHALSNFSGRIVRSEAGQAQIHAIWVLGRQFEDEARSKPTQVWNSFLVNTDVFTKTAEED